MLRHTPILLLCISFLVTACDESGDSLGAPTTPSSPITTPVGTVEATGFWVNASVTDNLAPILVNLDGSYGTDCFIDATTTTTQPIVCHIDIMELDLYVNEISIQYNSPPGLCEHVITEPAWHWNESFGVGPSRIELEITEPLSADPFVSDCMAFDDETSSMVACSSHKEIAGFDTDGVTCIYDRTSVERSNCCFGNYTSQTTTISFDSSTVPPTPVTTVGDPEERIWGEDYATCIGGPGRTSWDNYSRIGLPVGRVQQVEPSGLSEEFLLISNASTSRTSFSTMSNFYTISGTPHNHSGYVLAGTTNLPYSVSPIDDLDGTDLSGFTGREYFRVSCVDGADEVIHEFHVYLREWNSFLDFSAYQTSNGVTYNPDNNVNPEDGTTCGISPLFASPCNDFRDMDDLLPGGVGPYVLINTAPTAASTRRTYFPNVLYE